MFVSEKILFKFHFIKSKLKQKRQQKKKNKTNNKNKTKQTRKNTERQVPPRRVRFRDITYPSYRESKKMTV